MTDTEILEWLNLGMDIGAHTKSHVDLTSITENKALMEIRDCKNDLEKKFNISITDFCYPFGRFNDLISNIVKDSGYLSATTMNRGRVDSNSHKYMLSRVPINHRTLPHLFILKILSKYEDRKKNI